jgi:ComF family protein
MRDAGVPLAKLLLYYVKTISADLCGYTVVPIPLSRKRERVRGFNQAELVGSMFARESSLPLDTDIIFRREHRKPQSETRNIKERRENIRGCYSLCPRSRPVPKSIVLIDDVTTSGATFREAITVLASAGIENIFALAVAKA